VILSEERQTHLAHVVIDGIWKDDLVDYTDEDAAVRAAKRMIEKWVAEEDNIDAVVRSKVTSLKRTVVEGTTEWDLMYSKYYEEEMRKRGNK
jgi:hypothetical protein